MISFEKFVDFVLFYSWRDSNGHCQTEFLDACNLSGIDHRECPPLDGDAEIKFNPSSHMWKKEGDHPGLSSPEHRFVLEIEKELTFQRGVINLILGPTASGKTSVLMALLGARLVVEAIIYLFEYYIVQARCIPVLVASIILLTNCPEQMVLLTPRKNPGYSMTRLR